MMIRVRKFKRRQRSCAAISNLSFGKKIFDICQISLVTGVKSKISPDPEPEPDNPTPMKVDYRADSLKRKVA